jgi:hypothetical protein
MHHLISTGPLAPKPGLAPTHPWRFAVGQYIYLASHPQNISFEVIGGELHLGFPHLHLRDITGSILRVSQLSASSKPIPVK